MNHVQGTRVFLKRFMLTHIYSVTDVHKEHLQDNM